MNDFKGKLSDLLDLNRIKTEEPMKNHTTFRIGGPASYFVLPETKEEVQKIVLLCKEEKMPFYVIGNGSNLLVGDKGFPGCIIQVLKGMDWIRFEENGKVRAGAGAMLSKLAVKAAQTGRKGLVFATGIPGTLGGAVTMNAGAYGGEIKDCIVEALVIDEAGECKTLKKEELLLGYRQSVVQEKGYIVLEAVFELEEGDAEELLQQMKEINQKRREKQPLEFPSAGSTFKRPKGYFAGKLIQDAGLSGFRIGGAEVSSKHCGFVVNAKDATAADVKELIRQVDDRVFKMFGVHLEPEVRMIGSF